MAYDEVLLERRAQIARAARVSEKDATPSIRNLAQTLTSGRAAVVVPVLNAAFSLWGATESWDAESVAKVTAEFDDAEAPAQALCIGDRHDLLAQASRAAGSLPLLRADLLLEEHEVFASRALGADGVLFLASALGAQLSRCVRAARATHMLPVVLVTSPEECSAAQSAGAGAVAFDLRADVASLFPLIPARALGVGLLFGESSRAELARYEGKLDAVLAVAGAVDPVAAWRRLAEG